MNISQYSAREMVIYAGLTEVKTSLTNIETTRATLESRRTALAMTLMTIRTNALAAVPPSCATPDCNTLRTGPLNTLSVIAPAYTVT